MIPAAGGWPQVDGIRVAPNIPGGGNCLRNSFLILLEGTWGGLSLMRDCREHKISPP